MQQRDPQPGGARPDDVSAPQAGQGATPRRALLLDSDLFFAVKVAETLRHAGYSTHTVRRAEDFAPALERELPAVAVVNAGARGLDWHVGVEAARAAGVPVVVYAPHVDVATHEAARAAGATSVIANSKLATDLPGVVARALRRGVTAPNPASTADGDPGGKHAGEADGEASDTD